MAEARFFCADLTGDQVHLSGEEARHAAAVRRLKPGDEIELFDGHGTLARAVIDAVSRRSDEVSARILDRRMEPAPARALHLACALPKGDRQQVLLDMATQLGMTHFTPLLCERGVAQAGEAAMARATRIMLESCKQSRRAYLPVLCPPATPAETVQAAVARGELALMAHPDGQALCVHVGRSVTLLVGPEGGFTQTEVASALAAGAATIALGANILRIETAAVAMLGAISICRG